MTDYLPAVASETDRLLASARALAPESLRESSLCAGWSRGHVLTHVARNGDAMVNLATWATTGVVTPMYASPEARDAEIAEGAGRPLEEQVADLEDTAKRFAAIAARLRPEHDDVPVEARDGARIRASTFPFMRLREVVFHHVDLDVGYGFADVPDELTAAFLDNAVKRLQRDPRAPALKIRTDEGDAYAIGDGTAYVTGPRAAVLAWLARGLTDGVACDRQLPALPFGG